MHRWIARAAGGTSQRLKPGRAMMRSFDRKPGALATVPDVILLFMDCSFCRWAVRMDGSASAARKAARPLGLAPRDNGSRGLHGRAQDYQQGVT